MSVTKFQIGEQVEIDTGNGEFIGATGKIIRGKDNLTGTYVESCGAQFVRVAYKSGKTSVCIVPDECLRKVLKTKKKSK